jgi:hypothetical protein
LGDLCPCVAGLEKELERLKSRHEPVLHRLETYIMK